MEMSLLKIYAKVNFERGQKPMVSLGIGKEANPIRIFEVKEYHHSQGKIVVEEYPLFNAQNLLRSICEGSESEVLFNMQDRNIMLVDHRGNSRDIKHMWGEWICLPGFTFRIPEFLKPEGARKI